MNPNNLPNTITFNSANSDWVMQITADRKIIVNEDVEVSKAAQTVLTALQPLLLKANPVKELTDEEIYDILWMHFPISDKEKNATMIAVMTHCIKTALRKAQEK